MFCRPKAPSSATSGLAASGLAAVGLAATAAARRSRRSSLVQGQRSVVPVRPGRSLKLGASDRLRRAGSITNITGVDDSQYFFNIRLFEIIERLQRWILSKIAIDCHRPDVHSHWYLNFPHRHGHFAHSLRRFDSQRVS